MFVWKTRNFQSKNFRPLQYLLKIYVFRNHSLITDNNKLFEQVITIYGCKVLSQIYTKITLFKNIYANSSKKWNLRKKSLSIIKKWIWVRRKLFGVTDLFGVNFDICLCAKIIFFRQPLGNIYIVRNCDKKLFKNFTEHSVKIRFKIGFYWKLFPYHFKR